MKKTELVFGLIAGGVVALWAICGIAYCYSTNRFEGSMLLGYISMILALSLAFVAVKNYRDKQNGGVISFCKAFRMALSITAIASTVYVLAWVIDYYLFIPDFMDKFSAQMLRDVRASGASKAVMDAQAAQVASMKESYKSPVMVVLFTYLEILPVALFVPLVTALILKRKAPAGNIAAS